MKAQFIKDRVAFEMQNIPYKAQKSGIHYSQVEIERKARERAEVAWLFSDDEGPVLSGLINTIDA